MSAPPSKALVSRIALSALMCRSSPYRRTNCRTSRHLYSTLTLSLGRGWRAAPGEVAFDCRAPSRDVPAGSEGQLDGRVIIGRLDCSVPELAEVFPDHLDLMKTEVYLQVRHT